MNEIEQGFSAGFRESQPEEPPGGVLGAYGAQAFISLDDMMDIKDILPVDPEGDSAKIHHGIFEIPQEIPACK
ncbi:MAG: hypothetical protein MUD15_01135 [Desulfobacterota bacterium]|nr:hypothetical protein [Thermodesulfobacteriota bacterium]